MCPGNVPKGLRIWALLGMTQAKENTRLVAPAHWDANTSLMNVLQNDSLIGADRTCTIALEFLLFCSPSQQVALQALLQVVCGKKNTFKD